MRAEAAIPPRTPKLVPLGLGTLFSDPPRELSGPYQEYMKGNLEGYNLEGYESDNLRLEGIGASSWPRLSPVLSGGWEWT